MSWKTVNTDNFNGDYPDEAFVTGIPLMSERQAKALADELNKIVGGEQFPRFWKAVPDDYVLQPGFEP